MRRIFAYLVGMLLFVSPLSAYARTVSLNEFISETIRNNPSVKGYIQEYSEAKGTEFSARGIDDVQFESLFTMARKENPQISGFDSTLDKQIGWEVGASKIVSQSGTRLGARYSDSWTRGRYPNLIIGGVNLTPLNPLYIPSITVSLMQPLMKNIAGIQDQLNLRVTRLQLDSANLTYQENIELFISEMTELYLRWLNAYNNANTFERVYRKLSQQVGLIREEVDAKVAEESDLYRVLEQQALYKATWEGFLAEYKGTTREVAAMMYPDNPPTDINPARVKKSFLAHVIGEGQGLSYLKNSSRLKGILDFSLAVQDEVLRANKNARFPDLDFSIQYRRHGAGTTFNNSHGSAFNNDDISGGLNLSVPITNRAARGTYRAQQARRKRTQLENDRTMLDASSQLEALYQQNVHLEKQVRAYEQQFNYGRKKIQEELEQYEDGRLTLFQLLQDQTNHLTNIIDLERARTTLARTRLLINELTDRSLVAFQGVIDEVVNEEDKEVPPITETPIE